MKKNFFEIQLHCRYLYLLKHKLSLNLIKNFPINSMLVAETAVTAAARSMLILVAIIIGCCFVRKGYSQINDNFRYYNIGVLIASQLNSPFDLERCGPAIDMALEEINEKFLRHHQVILKKVQER